MTLSHFKNFRLSSVAVTLLLAVYFTFALNIALEKKLFNIFQDAADFKIGFAISLFFFFIASFNILFTLFSWRPVQKPLFIILIPLSAAVSYAMYHYGIIFNTDMITNFVETDMAEAGSYVNIYSVSWVLVLGFFPSFLLYCINIQHTSPLREFKHKALSVMVSAAVIGGIASLYYVDYVTVARNNDNIQRMIVPTYYLSSGYKFIKKNYLTKPVPYREIGTDAHIASASANQKNLMVLVVGETARAKNYQLNGYDVPTNPFLTGQDVYSFLNVSSCGTATAVSVPCMFSHLTKQGYSKKMAGSQDNILDIAQRAGFQVTWLENNSSCKGTCENVEVIDVRRDGLARDKFCQDGTCHDEIMIPNIQKAIADTTQNNRLIVLHLNGSHGPTYYQRYPDEFAVFKPDCARSDIQNCSQQQVVNTYDNTIRYTDYVLSKVIETLKDQGDDWTTSMLYISDHGESLGEGGLYLHGMPYSFAPDEQTHIPMIAWFSNRYKIANRINPVCLNRKAETGHFSHDNLFHTALGMMDIHTEIYDSQQDAFGECFSKPEILEAESYHAQVF